MSFTGLPFQVATADGRNCVLLRDVLFTTADRQRYCIPAGATSDGASTPPEIWPLIPPFGKYWPAAFLHDAAYRGQLLKSTAGDWPAAALERHAADDLFLEAMLSLGVPRVEATAIYEAVRLAGGPSFEADRKTL